MAPVFLSFLSTATAIPWPHGSPRATAGQQHPLLGQRLWSWEHAWGVATRLPTAVAKPQYCVHLVEVPGACRAGLETLRKPQGLAANKGSLSPLCGRQLASLRDGLSCSTFTKKLGCCLIVVVQNLPQAWIPEGKEEDGAGAPSPGPPSLSQVTRRGTGLHLE